MDSIDDVKEFLENGKKDTKSAKEERSFERGSVIYDYFSNMASDAGGGIVLNGVTAGASRDMFWAQATYINPSGVMDDDLIERLADAFSRSRNNADSDMLFRKISNQPDDDRVTVTLQMGFSDFIEKANF